MLPLIGSGSFSTSHVVDWSVRWYASSMTVPETGIGFRLGVPTSSFTTAGMQGAGDSSTYISSNATSVLSSWSTYGRTPSVADYWAAGAPPGISKARYVVYHYRGFISSGSARSWAHPTGTTSSFWFSFSGKGYIKVVVNGGTVLNTILDPKGIASSSLITPTVGHQVDIYYWQLGEEWGGVVGKYVVQQGSQSSDPADITEDQYRDAPVISSSMIPYTTANPVTLPDVLDANVDINQPQDSPSFKFTLPLKDNEASYGWTLLENPRRLLYTGFGGSPAYTVKRRQLINFYAGFKDEQYQRFSGYIEDIDENNGVITVQCVGHANRMAKVHVENFPDRISYSSYYYFEDETTSEPVYNITAYDSWPLEYAIKDLCIRGGIDPRLFYVTRQTNNVNGSVTDIQDELGNKHYYLRAKTLSGDLLKLQRPRRYGNSGAGFSNEKPNDDEYSYKPEASNSVLDFCKELADSLGYDFRTNALGAVVLASRNNPHHFVEITGGTGQISPSAIEGNYTEYAGSFNLSYTVNTARVDLVVGREATLGITNYSVHIMSGVQVASGTVNLALAGETSGLFYYDNRFTVTGANLCSTKLYTGKWGQYEVRLSRNTGTNWLDSLILYDYDSEASQLPEVLLTNKTIEQLSTSSRSNEIANHVVVIGKRKATITDSEKNRNPNNPEAEYFVAAGTDPSSIWDPDASNYTGGKISSFIVDSKISDQDYANWVAQTLLTRQRDPAPSVQITVPCLPVIEPRDPITVSDEAYGSISSSSLQWVVGVSETYSPTSMSTQITTTAYKEIPSYEPREDLAISVIDATYGGQPAINFNVSYPCIDNWTITNPGDNLENARTWGFTRSTYLETYQGILSPSSDGNGKYLSTASPKPWPPIPDSIALGRYNLTSASGTAFGVYKNNPYQKFTHVYDYTVKRIHIPTLTGDQTTNYSNTGTDPSSYLFGYNQIPLTYVGISDGATIYSGTCPFYDPYLSELPDGALINISFDMLISGYYRVSVWDARNRNDPTLVAWLTEPGEGDSDEEKHWTYYTAGTNRLFLWDGVDNVGTWNQKQSSDYSWTARGWFEQDQNPLIGRGFYVWNDRSAPIIAISGQTTSGKLDFNPDKFSKFYIKVEVTSDKLTEYSELTGAQAKRTISSLNLANAPTQNPKSQILIYTHLPPPNKVTISSIEDWDPATKTYSHETDAYGATGWSTGSTDDAGSITNTKPVRLTFSAVARPGVRFGGNNLYTNVKLHRVAHLGYYVMDQFVTYMGEPWHQGTDVEKKRVTSRRLFVSDKTLDFADTDYRNGDTLDVTTNKWVFRPQDFEVDNNGVKEPLEYCDYLQLEEVPDYSVGRAIGERRSRFNIAYMGYVFYFSAYTQDRSGRMVWVIDDSFVDKAKILENTFATTFPEDLEQYSTRTIIARQWVDTGYRDDLITNWNIPATNPRNYVQFYHNRLEPNDNASGDPLRIDVNGDNVTGFLTTGYTDPYAQDQQGSVSNIEKYGKLPATYLINRQLGEWTTAGGGTITSFFGDWTWEGDAAQDQRTVPHELLWIPDLTRDFHPFHLIPPMPFYEPRYSQTTEQYSWLTTTNSHGEHFDDTAAYEILQSKAWENSDTIPRNANDLYFKQPYTWEVGENGEVNATTKMHQTQFNYVRQDEIIHWEEFRGVPSVGKQPDRPPVLVQATAGAYLVNPYRYSNHIRVALIENLTDDGDFDTIWRSFEYLTKIKTPQFPSSGSTSDRGLFGFTFRTIYNWHSSSFFPTDRFQRLEPKFLYPKYTVGTVGQPTFYDNGAWVGWKDDLDPGSDLVWKDSAAFGSPKPSSETSPPYNIFDPAGTPDPVTIGGKVSNIPRPARKPIALGPRLTESRNLIVSLSLVNSRRTVRVPGK